MSTLQNHHLSKTGQMVDVVSFESLSFVAPLHSYRQAVNLGIFGYVRRKTPCLTFGSNLGRPCSRRGGVLY